MTKNSSVVGVAEASLVLSVRKVGGSEAGTTSYTLQTANELKIFDFFNAISDTILFSSFLHVAQCRYGASIYNVIVVHTKATFLDTVSKSKKFTLRFTY